MAQRGVLEKAFVILLTAGIAAGVNAEDPPFNLPAVQAVPATDGGQIICAGYACAEVLESLMPAMPDMSMYQEVISLEDPPYDRDQFCAALKTKKPPGCNASNPPSTADTDPNWQPNGCGNNWRVQAAMQLGIMAIVPSNFAGNYNAPYTGVSFLEACNAHDPCYSVAFDKAFCDDRFGSDMLAACGVVSDSAGHGVCKGLAGIYEGAVASTTFGANAYASSVSAHTCAVWVRDMEANGCND